jgi:phosphate transport system substrate-binding protein
MRKIQIFALVSFFLFLNPARLESINELRGKAFCDPSYQVNMPEKWNKEKIKHESWAEDADITLSVSQHLYPAVLPIIEKYEKNNDISIALKKSICGITAGRLARKSIDIGIFCCPPGLGDRLPDIKFYTIGISPIALLVNINNPVDNITFKEAQRIFQGEIHRWSELKGRDASIYSAVRLHCAMRPGRWRLLLANEELFGPHIHEVASINNMILSIANNQNAIGYASLWQITNHKRSKDIKVIKIDGYDPANPSDLLFGRYPLYHTFTAAIWEGKDLENPHAGKLLEYIVKEIDKVKSTFYIVTAPSLRKAGWKFNGHELIGEKRK